MLVDRHRCRSVVINIGRWGEPTVSEPLWRVCSDPSHVRTWYNFSFGKQFHVRSQYGHVKKQIGVPDIIHIWHGIELHTPFTSIMMQLYYTAVDRQPTFLFTRCSAGQWLHAGGTITAHGGRDFIPTAIRPLSRRWTSGIVVRQYNRLGPQLYHRD